MISQRPRQLNLQNCAACGSYNPRGFASCGGCGKPLTSGDTETALAAVGTGAKVATKHAAARTAPFSAVPLWPLWTTSDEQRLGCALAGLPGFTAGRSLLGADRKTGLAIDEHAHKLCVFEVMTDTKRGGKDMIQRRIVGYEAIAEVRTVDGVFRRPLTKATGAADEIVALMLGLEQGGIRFEALVNLMSKPQPQGSGNHRTALMRAKEWQAYLIGLMHLPGLLAFSAGAASG